MAREHTLQLLESLLARRREAVQLHDVWAESLKSPNCRKTVRAVGLIHGVRSLELARSAELMGGKLPTHATPSPRIARRLRTKLASVWGDQAIMRRLESRQARLVEAYSRAVRHPSSKPVQHVLERHLVEEQRHLAWLGYRRHELGRARRRPGTA
jgi:hypothetical protein